jgi:outer membrane protein OmpA-like peptidoglycan-associated protein
VNKQFYMVPLLLLVPACGSKNKKPAAGIVYPPYTNQAPYIEEVQNTPEPLSQIIEPESTVESESENVDAFVLEEDKNPFNVTVGTTEEELTSANSEDPSCAVEDDNVDRNFYTINYDFDGYDIRPDQQAALAHNLQTAKELINKGYSVTIEGHACNYAGDTQYNMALSEDRARGAAHYFKQNGIDKKLFVDGTVKVVGYGSTMPLVPSGNKEQQAPNRRVEIHALSHTRKCSS